MFIIGHLRGRRARNIFPIIREDAKSDNQQSKIEIVGNTKNPNGTGKCTGSIVYNSNGLVGTLLARDYKEPKQIAIPNEIKKFGVLQPNYNQSGVVYDTDGIAPTIRAYRGGNLEPKIRVKEATKQGYAEAEVGDSINLSHPNSKTRRGRVGKQIANTLLTGESQGVVEPDFRIRKLTPRECWRLQGFPNWSPTSKALLDGLTDAEFWTDDNYNIIKEVSFCHGGKSGTGKYTIKLEITEIDC